MNGALDGETLASLPQPFGTLASQMPPIEAEVLLNNANLDAVGSTDLLAELQETLQGWPGQPGQLMHVPYVLSADECANLRDVVDGALDDPRRRMLQRQGLVDGAPEFQQNISDDQLASLIGEDAVGRVWQLAACMYRQARPGALDALCAEMGADVPSCPACWWIYIRRYTPDTRPWFGARVAHHRTLRTSMAGIGCCMSDGLHPDSAFGLAPCRLPLRSFAPYGQRGARRRRPARGREARRHLDRTARGCG